MASGYKILETEDAGSIKPTSSPPYQFQGSPNPTIQSPAAPPPYPFQDDSNSPSSYEGASQQQYRQVVNGQREPCEDWKTYFWAFIGILVFFPFGIVACIKIIEMNVRLDTGDREGANISAIRAKYWASVGLLVLTGVLIVGSIIAAFVVMILK